MKNALIIVCIVLIAVIFAQWQQVKYANEKWETSEANVKAYSEELSASKKKNTVYKLTVDQLEYFKDSIFHELDNTRKELKIKDNKLKSLQYVASNFSKADTVTVRDTIFKDKAFKLDTLMGDKWYSLRLGLHYPSMIAVKPEFKSEKHIVVYSKKETVNPPKKFFLFRWFQKKHTIINVEVKEKNPYANDEGSRYVEIIN